MLRLTNDKIRSAEEARTNKYVKNTCDYLGEVDAFHMNAIGYSSMEDVVRLGIFRASRHGFTEESATRVYIRMMLYLGSYFDEDPLLPWVKEELMDRLGKGSQHERVNLLRSRFISYLEEVSGRNGNYLQNFMRVSQLILKDQDLIPVGRGDIFLFLRENYNQQFEYSKNILPFLLRDSEEICVSFGLIDQKSWSVMSILRVIFGFEIYRDPLFPWLSNLIYRNHDGKDKLFLKVVQKFLDNIVAYVDGKSGHVG